MKHQYRKKRLSIILSVFFVVGAVLLSVNTIHRSKDAEPDFGTNSVVEQTSDRSLEKAEIETVSTDTNKDAQEGAEAVTDTDTSGLDITAKAAILIDGKTGTVLYQKNAHESLPPASVTKVMSMLLVMEAVDSGHITLEDKVTISERAAKMGGSQLFMEPGEQHTVAELMKGVAMASANDGCVAFNFRGVGEEKINQINHFHYIGFYLTKQVGESSKIVYEM